ncbi:MAG TPA: methyltransferase domain-containing protein [Acetobacteraceae bacterium]|nr:methyltransferase domain-containing protein [Acetobacteraceae bacterium]
MSTSQQSFAAAQYSVRAQDYVTSAVHSSGADLDQIEAHVRGHATARVLDLGCGGGHVSYRAAPHVAAVVACDVTQDMLDAVARTAAERGLDNISVRQAAAEDLPFADASFDMVLCRFTVHHWQSMEAGLRQARRVLKPEHTALFIDTVAAAEPVFDTHLQAVELLRDVSHVRNYSTAEWVAALARAGFRLDGITQRRLRMEFPVWTARTRTPEAHVAAIRSLQRGAPAQVQRHFAIDDDGSFDIETVTFLVRAV